MHTIGSMLTDRFPLFRHQHMIQMGYGNEEIPFPNGQPIGIVSGIRIIQRLPFVQLLQEIRAEFLVETLIARIA